MAIQPFFLFIAFFFFVSKLNNISAAPSATTTTTTATTTNNNNNYAIGVPIDSEMNALLDIKHSLIDTEGHLNNWVIHLQEQGDGTGDGDGDDGGSIDYAMSPCSWNGVKCSSSRRNHGSTNAVLIVESLDLSNMSLSGSLSSSIGLLHNLVNLTIASNNLTGPLPPSVCDIGPTLRSLNISNNLFNGFFLAQNLTNLASLHVLDAYNNNFTGPLPLEISKLNSLHHLHLGGNYFEGTIPPQYGSLMNLSYLALSGNSLTGRIPVEIGNLALLEDLYLGYYNQFDAGIPSALGRLTRLVRLDLADCGLSGNIPPHLGNLTNLDSLFLQINSLSGSIPEELGMLVSLRSLDLSNNLISGHIPDTFSGLSRLELLNLFRNRVQGPIPGFIATLPSLQVLSLWENNMTGMVPQTLGSHQGLLTLDLSSNSFYGPIPPSLCAMGRLERLILFNNMLSGSIPLGLGQCLSLTRLRFGHNSVNGSIPDGLISLPSLQILEAPNNQLTGSIILPHNMSLVDTKMGRLDLSRNSLTGSIPSSLSSLSSLQALLLQDNMLTGPIPSEISSLNQISKLDLSGNRLDGSIPSTLGQCEDLTYLDLSKNKLDGEIPATLQNLGVLDYLNLSRNRLYGAIPISFQKMQTLTSVDFSYNNLSGVIPNLGQFATFNKSSFVGNAGLCGDQIDTPCNSDMAMNTNGSTRRRGGKPQPETIYWIIVGSISSLTVMVFIAGIVYNRHAFFSLLGHGDGFTLEPWKLTAYQKLDFSADHVLACLSDDNIIGKGGSGIVYRCSTPSGYVAVKKLPTYNTKVGEHHHHNHHHTLDDHGFSAEIQTLGKIRHRNIVRLLGCCSSRDTNLLVYEYMPNGSLGELLHGPRGGSLDWSKRYKIATEAAQGLHYLHHDCSPIIVHRDVKSNNILLDSKYEAHVADFGLAKVLHFHESMSSVAGSYGYIAPEYVYTLKVDEKSDIYSFGVVLLELVTGRRPFEPEFGEAIDIAQWVRKKLQSKEGLMEVIDPRIKPDSNREPNVIMTQIMLVLKVALHCLAELPMQRPTMREVLQMLTNSSSPSSSSSLSSSFSKQMCTDSPPDLISI